VVLLTFEIGNKVRVISEDEAKTESGLDREYLKYLRVGLQNGRYTVEVTHRVCDICGLYGHAIIDEGEKNPVCRNAEHYGRPTIQHIRVNGILSPAIYFRSA
jgi:hypothetical protein